jgi:hypothetical protein
MSQRKIAANANKIQIQDTRVQVNSIILVINLRCAGYFFVVLLALVREILAVGLNIDQKNIEAANIWIPIIV